MDTKTAIENLLLGIFASAIVWAVFSRAIQPRLGISKAISKVPPLIQKSDLFRIKIENLGLLEVYDVQLVGRFFVFLTYCPLPTTCKPLISLGFFQIL